ncbi:MAG: chloride channel protein [Epsilonproteobacteria bacterium]|nr:chloride channel protein [Campylobacterota bacterium]
MAFRLLISTILIGIITGGFIVIYTSLTALLQKLLYFKEYELLPFWYRLLVPLGAIFLVNYIISKYESVKEYGVREIAEAIEENKIVFGIKELFLKIFASALSIASGFAIGNEGPSAVIGAMIANKIHSFLKLPRYFLKVCISIGASSGIAAVFVSPITGIMFAVENLAYEFVRRYAGYLILGSVIAFSIAYKFMDALVFHYSSGKVLELKYVVATLLFIPVMTLFIYLYLEIKDRILEIIEAFLIERFLPYKNYILGFIGALVIALFGHISTLAIFSGHEVVKELINGEVDLPAGIIFMVVFLRIVATSVSLYANAVGGVFIAFMSIGALIGYGFSHIAAYFGYVIEPFYFAAIGAAVFMGVNMKLPITALVFALEMTYDYNVVIPTGISVAVIAYLVSLQFNIKRLYLKEEL